jgi:hypothetical protein
MLIKSSFYPASLRAAQIDLEDKNNLFEKKVLQWEVAPITGHGRNPP